PRRARRRGSAGGWVRRSRRARRALWAPAQYTCSRIYGPPDVLAECAGSSRGLASSAGGHRRARLRGDVGDPAPSRCTGVVTTEPPDLGVAGSDGFVRAVAGFLSLAGLALAAVRFAGSLPAERGPEAALGAFAMGAPVVA